MDSESNRRIAVAAYRRWWQEVQDEDETTRRETDPLQGTGLHWH